MTFNVKMALTGVCLLFVLTGCGSSDPELGQVTGTVKYNGQPRADVRVTFQPKTGGVGAASAGVTDANGKYELTYDGRKKGAIVGPNRVEFTSATGGGEAGGEAAVAPLVIPPSYNVESTITKDVAAGENTFDFEIITKTK